MFFEDCCSGKPTPTAGSKNDLERAFEAQSAVARFEDYRNEATIYAESRNIQLLFQFQCGIILA